MKTTAIVFMSALVAGTVFAGTQQDRDVAEEKSDSLRAELQRVNEELERAENKQKIDTATAQIEAAKRDSSADTASLDEAKNLLGKVKGHFNSSSRQGFGGSGGLFGGAAYLDMTPIKDLLTRELKLSGSKSALYGTGIETSFENRELILMKGGIGLGGIGNGVRIGGAGINGTQEFSVRKADSVYTLKTELSYGGFILAKQFGFGKNNLTISGLFGGGSMDVNICANQSNGSSGLSLGGNPKWNDSDGNAFSSGTSRFFVTDLSGTYTYSFLKWLHAGVDIGGFVQYSQKGFNGTNGYTTVNPVGRVRILFGRLG